MEASTHGKKSTGDGKQSGKNLSTLKINAPTQIELAGWCFCWLFSFFPVDSAGILGVHVRHQAVKR